MNLLQKEVSIRLTRVNNRLNALEKERIQLLAEQQHLAELKEIYSNMVYDPIEEERRVTEQILNEKKIVETTRKTPPKQKRVYTKRPSKYDEPIEIVFTTLPNPIKFDTIAKELNNLLPEPIAKNVIGSILNKQIKDKNVEKIDYGLYQWTGGNNHAAKTLPDRGCPEA